MKIDRKTYRAKEGYYKSKYKKKQIILGGSLRAESNHVIHNQVREYGKTKKWSTYTIRRDGKIYEHFDPKYYSDYLGIKEIDKHSISIVLENMGSVFYDYNSDKWLNWAMEVCNESFVHEKGWKGNRYWEIYTDEQFVATVNLCKFLFEKHDITQDCLGYNVYKDGTKDFEGVVTRSNFDIDYNDLNPSFDFKRFLTELGIEVDYN